MIDNTEQQYWENEGVAKHTETYNADELDAEDVKEVIEHVWENRTDIKTKA